MTVPPPLATIILDTNVGEPWLSAIDDFEKRFEALKLRGRVKAARDLAEVVEGLRIVVRLLKGSGLYAESHTVHTGSHETATVLP